MTAAEGEVVLVVEKKSAEGDWVVVENSQVINMGSNYTQCQGGLKMDFGGTPGSKYDFTRNASSFFYS